MVADNSARLGLTINRGKRKVFGTSASNNTPITVQGEELEEVESFTISADFWTTREERMQISELASVKHEQPSIS
ncbi:hypothetical protein DPMN_103744 [Dreissena polymorpha]|uniref:Uncharacterized protein n=1 Tax=Dreissena polymorpha TaxID=45954 RepID=A0A9D4H8M2_DREPO|nr:hypothetical protein DPMN_103744 [Dreissena polymorpha]